ncbi:nucleoporin NUP35-like [Dendronephthya gigantea]|uniref:nucleoporin NUP35-like n=1 Tax=Dendronephthya gigantea TaxID=151771 RepID=UPI00106A7BDF|nr:nucleoporin NUP35-like [Dendronephthya gigantea]
MDSSFSRVPSTGLQQSPLLRGGGMVSQTGSMSFGTPTHGQNTSSYLPGYLLGGHTPSQMSHSHDMSYVQSTRKSPGKMKSWSPSRSGGPSYSSHSKTSTNRDRKDSRDVRNTFESNTPKSLRGKAPPVADLFSENTSVVQTGSPLRRDNHNMDVHMMTLQSQTNSPSRTPQQNTTDFREHLLSPSRKHISSPAQIDPFYSQGENITTNEVLDECSITAFGFPPSASSFLLQQFSQYGSILKHEVASNGNWMHVKYQSKLQAKKALSKNGKIFGNNMMVGVKQCIDKNFMFETGKENLPSSITKSTISSDVAVSSPSRKTPIRPLTAAYHAASSDLEVSGSTSNTPQKSNNLVSKAMEYVFGW